MSKIVTPLHYCPDNGWFGDAMPMYHNGEFHIYFNKPTRFYAERKGRGGWGHISTKDFITYTEHPDAFVYENSKTGENFGNPVNSGCVFWGKGEWHAYYASPDYFDHVNNVSKISIRHAVSDDGISFRYVGEIFERLDDCYRIDHNFRDPSVIWDEKNQEYHMVFCAKSKKTKDGPNYFSGTVGRAVSKDLYNWECLPPMKIDGVANTMECPEVYHDDEHNRWVMLYYFHETRIRTAANIEGPWERGNVIAPDNFDFMAGRQAFDGKRHVMFAWTTRRDKMGQMQLSRCLLFPRELRLLDDGKTPATRFVREIETLFNKKNTDIVPEKIVPGAPGWRIDGNVITAEKLNGGTMAGWKNLPDVCYIKMDITIEEAVGQVNLMLGTFHEPWSGNDTSEWADAGTQLIIDLPSKLLRLREHYEWDQKPEITVLPYDLQPKKKISLEILRDGEVLEIGINGEQTMVIIIPGSVAGNFAISVQDSAATIENLSVWETDAFLG